MRKFNDTKSKTAIILTVILSFMTVFAENLVKSPDFEDLHDWTIVDYNEKTNYEITAKDGVLKISSPEDNHIYVWQSVPVESDKIYKFSAEIKTENIPDKENGALLGIYYKIAYSNEVRGTTDDFMPVEMYFTTKNKSVPLMLSLGGYGRESSGTAYFRNVSVEEADTVPRGAHYYEYTDGAQQVKEFDKRWYLLCALLIITVTTSVIYVYKNQESN